MVSATTPEFYIRKATLDDLNRSQEIVDVFNRAYSHNSAGWATLSENIENYYTTKEAVESLIKKSCQDEQVIQLFAVEKSTDAIVGTLSVETESVLLDSLSKEDGLLGRFSIRPDLQSKGLGTMIINAGLEAMKQVNYTVCSILVFENRDNVLRWYEKLGFVRRPVRRPYILPQNSHAISDHYFILMQKSL